jgi:hypothetical protein
VQKQATKTTALDSFMDKHFQLGEMIKELQTRQENFYDASPDSLHWGHVGDLDHCIMLMGRILNGEG